MSTMTTQLEQELKESVSPSVLTAAPVQFAREVDSLKREPRFIGLFDGYTSQESLKDGLNRMWQFFRSRVRDQA